MTEEEFSAFIEELNDSIESGQFNIVAQMDRSESYDSFGLDALVELQERLREKGGNLKISGLGEPGRKIFEVTRLDRQFDIFDSVIDAVSSFQ